MKEWLSEQYDRMKEEYISGWKTWNVRSVLSHVLMPLGLAVNLCVKEYQCGGYLKEALIGRLGQDDEKVHPGAHGSEYTCLRVEWRQMAFRVKTACEGERFAMMVIPERTQIHPAMLVLETGFLWNRPGAVEGNDAWLTAKAGEREIVIKAFGVPAEPDLNYPSMSRSLALALTQEAVFCTGEFEDMEQAREFIERKELNYDRELERYGEDGELYSAIQSAMNWDTIYDAKNRRIISPVSRIWSVASGGYVLFCWDNYFAGLLAALFDSSLAAANLMEITSEQTADGFIPNFAYGTGQRSLDRSQPPVGSAMTWAVYNVTRQRWLIEALYPALTEWNRWFYEHRMHSSGALGWGSNPCPVQYGNVWETVGVNDRYGAALESGLDNSPMYDDVPFDKERHLLCQEDVGLTGLFIMDCRALMRMARELGRDEDIARLKGRMEQAERGLDMLWSERHGMYMNRRTDTGEFSEVLSPTNFYALFSDSVSKERLLQIQRCYFDPEIFYGDWVLPSVMRSHPAFEEQDYWRGRIWAPLNFLVYLAVSRHDLPDMRRNLAEKSRDLFLKEWRACGHIHENYSAISGEGCDKANSDRFYHWGALLAAIWLIEKGELGDECFL